MKITSLVPFILTTGLLHAASYDTLPQGINTFVFKQVITNTIESKYDANKSDKTLLINEKFTTSTLSGFSDAIGSYFQELKNISPESFNSFSLGEFEAKATANVNVQGLGFGRGITNHLTVYGSLPIYHLKSNVNFYQKTPSNINEIKNNLINSNPTTAIGTFVKQLTLQLPDSNESLLQSVLVNYYHYKPLGLWEKDALGDIELGAIYRLTDLNEAGISVTTGLVLPTGTKDDPNSLQDISSGDGQFDLFAESNIGISYLEQKLKFDITGRFTYQLGSNKELRLYTNSDTPLSDVSGNIYEKLGNKLDGTAAITFSPYNWLNFTNAYLISQTGKTDYNISNDVIKKALETGTETKSEWLKVSVGLSTVELYKRKKFEIPFEVNLSAQQLINAKNSASYNRYDLDFKFYF